jgi:cell shape-determining protein MreC
VAIITEVLFVEGDAFATVFAAPSSLLDRGRYVLVVMWGDRQREGAP